MAALVTNCSKHSKISEEVSILYIVTADLMLDFFVKIHICPAHIIEVFDLPINFMVIAY